MSGSQTQQTQARSSDFSSRREETKQNQGSSVASAGESKESKSLEPEVMRTLTLAGYCNYVTALTSLSDGTLVSGSYYGEIQFWDPKTGTCLKTLTHGKNAMIDFLTTLDDGTLISWSFFDTKHWNPKTGKCVKTFSGSQHYYGNKVLTVLANETLVSTVGTKSEVIKLWNLKTCKCLKTFLTERTCYALTTLSDGTLVISSLNDEIEFRDPKSGKCLKTLNVRTIVVALTTLADDTLVIGDSQREIKFWNPKTGECLKILTGHINNVYSFTVSADGILVSCSSKFASVLDGEIKFWNPKTGECLKTLTGYNSHNWPTPITLKNGILAVPEGSKITLFRLPPLLNLKKTDEVSAKSVTPISASTTTSVESKTSFVVETKNSEFSSQRETKETKDAKTETVQATLDQNRLGLATFFDPQALCAQIDSGKLPEINLASIGTYNRSGHEPIRTVEKSFAAGPSVLTQDQQLIIGFGEGQIRIYNLETGAIKELRVSQAYVTMLAALKDGKIIVVSGGLEKTICIYDFQKEDGTNIAPMFEGADNYFCQELRQIRVLQNNSIVFLFNRGLNSTLELSDKCFDAFQYKKKDVKPKAFRFFLAIWDPVTKKWQEKNFIPLIYAFSLEILPNNQIAVFARDVKDRCIIEIYDPIAPKLIRRIYPPDNHQLHAMCILANGYVAGCVEEIRTDKVFIMVWNPSSGSRVNSIRLSGINIREVSNGAGITCFQQLASGHFLLGNVIFHHETGEQINYVKQNGFYNKVHELADHRLLGIDSDKIEILQDNQRVVKKDRLQRLTLIQLQPIFRALYNDNFLGGFANNRSVVTMNLQNTDIDDEAVPELVVLLTRNNTLTRLDLRETNLTQKGITALLAGIKNRKTPVVVLHDYQELLVAETLDAKEIKAPATTVVTKQKASAPLSDRPLASAASLSVSPASPTVIPAQIGATKKATAGVDNSHTTYAVLNNKPPQQLAGFFDPGTQSVPASQPSPVAVAQTTVGKAAAKNLPVVMDPAVKKDDQKVALGDAKATQSQQSDAKQSSLAETKIVVASPPTISSAPPQQPSGRGGVFGMVSRAWNLLTQDAATTEQINEVKDALSKQKEDVAVLAEKLKDSTQSLTVVEQKLKHLDPLVLEELQTKAAALIKNICEEKTTDALHKAILSDGRDFIYYSVASVLSCGTHHACGGVRSGFVAAGKSDGDTVAQAFEAMGSVPLVGFAASFVSGVIGVASTADKLKKIALITTFLAKAKNPEAFLRHFARLLTFARRAMIRDAAQTLPVVGTVNKIKKGIADFAALLKADGSNNPIMLQATKDIKLVIDGIVSGRLSEPNHEDMLLVCLGDKAEVSKVLKEVAALTSESVSIPVSAERGEQKRAVPATVAQTGSQPSAAEPIVRPALSVQAEPKKSDAALLTQFTMLSTHDKELAEVRAELERQRRETELAKEALRRQEVALAALHQKMSGLSTTDTAVSAGGRQLLLQSSQAATADGLSLHGLAAENASLRQDLGEVVGYVREHSDSIARLNEKTAERPPASEEKCLVM